MTIGISTNAAATDSSDQSQTDGRMQLVGTLRRRGAEFVLEEQLAPIVGEGVRWTTPRLYLLESTQATRAAADAAVGQLVTVSGVASRNARRLGAAIVLDSVTLATPSNRTI